MARGARPLDRHKKAQRAPKKQVFIYCEGKVTEKEYFVGIRSALRSPNLKIQIVPAKGNPLSIVEFAISHSGLSGGGDYQDGDQVWCAFDVEAPQAHPKIREALDLADKWKVDIAASNPCFELWLILHFADHRSYLTTNDACRALRQFMPNYDKHVSYDEISAKYSEARSRAIALDALHDEDFRLPDKNPCSWAWRIVDAVFELSKNKEI